MYWIIHYRAGGHVQIPGQSVLYSTQTTVPPHPGGISTLTLATKATDVHRVFSVPSDKEVQLLTTGEGQERPYLRLQAHTTPPDPHPSAVLGNGYRRNELHNPLGPAGPLPRTLLLAHPTASLPRTLLPVRPAE